jgi:hypothetical protein
MKDYSHGKGEEQHEGQRYRTQIGGLVSGIAESDAGHGTGVALALQFVPFIHHDRKTTPHFLVPGHGNPWKTIRICICNFMVLGPIEILDHRLGNASTGMTRSWQTVCKVKLVLGPF